MVWNEKLAKNQYKADLDWIRANWASNLAAGFIPIFQSDEDEIAQKHQFVDFVEKRFAYLWKGPIHREPRPQADHRRN